MPAAKDITGLRSGRLLVLELYGHRGKERIWKCRCDCGNLAYVRTVSLTTNYTKSCGCLLKEAIGKVRKGKSNAIDLTNKTFGRLRVQEREVNGKHRQSRWRCLCDCGTYVIVSSQPLLNGSTVSCGCYHKEQASKAATKHGLTGTRKHRAWLERRYRERSIIFDSSWSIETETELLSYFKSCVLCSSTDHLRVDHLLPLSYGYGLFVDNAVVLCNKCNSSKNNRYIYDLPEETRRKLIDASLSFQDYMDNKEREVF